MAQDYGYDSATSGTSISAFLGSNTSDGSTAGPSTTADFGNPTALKCAYECILNARAGASAYAYLKVAWSHDNTDFSDASNLETIGVIDCTSLTSSVGVGVFMVRARYAKFYLENQSGGTINNAGSTLALWDVFSDLA